METIKIFDTTLRDGEQSPGCSMNLEEKLRMATQLAKLNVDVIEAGFPVASIGDFESVQQIAKNIKGPVICGLARAQLKDIDRCWEAVSVAAPKARIHTFIATSDIHLKHKLKKTREEVIRDSVAAVAHARKYTPDVEFSAEDATRSDWIYLAEVFTRVIEAGASTINVPDTVGYAVPSQFGELIAFLKKNVPNINDAIISVHCHNDLGLAVSNSLAAIENGARQVECTVNGIGERAGNASMEEIAMTLFVRHDRMPFKTNIVTPQIYNSSKMLSSITGINVQPNKAVVGENAFAHESGIHQDGILKFKQTYEIMTPESVGIPRHKLVLGKHSGRHAFKDRLVALGITLDEALVEKTFAAFKALADKKKNVYDEDIIALIEGQAQVSEKNKLVDLFVSSGTQKHPHATVKMIVDGKEVETEEDGDGPVDAVFRAIRKLVGFEGTLDRYKVSAITGGTDAQGEVIVTISDSGKTVRGQGSHTDIVIASALAFITALNRVHYYKSKQIEGGI